MERRPASPVEAAARRFPWVGAAAALTCSLSAVPPPQTLYDHAVTPLLTKYCYDCHGHGHSKGDTTLDTYPTVASVLRDRPTWDTVLDHVRSGEMPPDDAKRQPTDAERETIAGWVEQTLYPIDPQHPDPGRVTLHRLNRAEYNNTIRDLIGVDFKAADDFPPDDSGYGFDNVSDVLSLSPSLLEKYLAAADRILDQSIVTEPIRSRVQRIPAALAQVGFNAVGDRGDGWVQLISLEEDDVAAEVSLPAAGDYRVRVMAFAKPRGGAVKGAGDNSQMPDEQHPDPMQLAIALNDAYVKRFAVTTDEAKPGVYEARIGAPAGRQRIRVVAPRLRGGDHELIMVNGRIGKQQAGILFVKWIEIEGPLPAATRRFPAELLISRGETVQQPGSGRMLGRDGAVEVKFSAAKAGDFFLRAQAYAHQSGGEPAALQLRVDGQPLQTFQVLAPATLQPLPKQHLFSLALLGPQPEVYEVHARLAAGPHVLAAAFLNPASDPANANPNLRSRRLVIQNLEIASSGAPVVIPDLPEPLRRLFRRYPGSNAKSARLLLTEFARRAWRRPLSREESDRLLQLFTLAEAQGDGFAAGIKLGMKAVLASPNFLFRDGNRLPLAARETAARRVPGSNPGVYPLDEFALASELSYFLWSSMPDDELFGLAARGQLRAHLDSQVRRMIASPKAQALVDNFAEQWLQIRGLETLQPDRTLFPAFDPALGLMMKQETDLFVASVMREDRSVLDFLTGDYTFVNSRLARLYGLPPVTGEAYQRVSLRNTPRRGVLTQASVLTLTSNPTRTSPVKRGKWVLENILGAPPPPPPPTIPSLDDKGRKLTGTLREQMAQHRTDPSCASCHARMDPIGFSLENFDAIGAWREKDGETPIDASGKLGATAAFSGAAGMADLLATQKRGEFLRCLAEKLLTYALGRGVERSDRTAVDEIVHQLAQDQYRWSSLVLGVVHSAPFQLRRSTDLPSFASAHSP